MKKSPFYFKLADLTNKVRHYNNIQSRLPKDWDNGLIDKQFNTQYMNFEFKKESTSKLSPVK